MVRAQSFKGRLGATRCTAALQWCALKEESVIEKRGKMPKTKALAAASSTKSPARKRAKPAVRSASAVSRRLRQIEDKRSAILGAALGLFSRFGLHGTSIDQVAARADVSKSNLLYYFANKEELYVSVLRDLLELWLEPLRGFSAEQDPGEAIGGYIRRKLVISRDRPDASRLFCLEMIQGAPLLRDELDRELRTLVERKSEVIRSWIEAGKLAPVDPHHLIFALWAITQHYADFGVQVQALTGHTLEDAAFFEQTVENVQRIVLQGIAPR
ncbi:transcriptional regulator, TetR family [Variovorax sp. OV700]|nr:transcriptional regulator, TetR family [Variovorax sp. OV700]